MSDLPQGTVTLLLTDVEGSTRLRVVEVEDDCGAAGGCLGGAAGRVGESAFGCDAPCAFVVLSVWSDPSESERHVARARGTWEAVQPFSPGGAYLNFIADEGKDQVQAIYGPANSERLVALKDRYDPDNVFRLNHNIPPSGRPG